MRVVILIATTLNRLFSLRLRVSAVQLPARDPLITL
jgi:hypothetical protein